MEDLLGDGKLLKKVLREGDLNCPPPASGDRVQVHYSCHLASDAAILDSSRGRGQPFTFTLGQGEVILGWEQALPTMRPGAHVELIVHPDLAYGEAGCGGGAVPSSKPGCSADGASLHFELELLEVQAAAAFVNSAIVEDMSPEERLLQASKSKEEGNEHFKAAAASDAALAYSRALCLLGFQVEAARGGQAFQDDDDDAVWSDAVCREARGKLALACRLNLCQCQLKLDDHAAALQQASAALELEPGNSKALYRRGLAQLGCGRLQEARADFHQAAKKEPRSSEIRAQLQECQKRLQEEASKEKASYGGFLGRDPASTEQESVPSAL